MRARAVPICLLLVLAGCQPAPDDLFFVVGTAFDGDGALLTDVTVELRRNTSEQCAFTPAPTGLEAFDGGTYEPLAQSQTTGKGEFALEYLFADSVIQSTYGPRPVCMKALLPATSSRGEGAAYFTPYDSDVELAGLVGWEAQVTLRQVGTDVELSVPRLATLPGLEAAPSPSGPEAITPFRIDVWQLASGDTPIWSELAKQAPLRLSAYALEDFPALTASVQSTGYFFDTASGPFGGTHPSYQLTTRALSAEVPHRARVPASRGVPCFFAGQLSDPCPITDGSLERISLFNGPKGPEQPPGSAVSATSIEVRFPAPRTFKWVVMRDLFSQTMLIGDRGAPPTGPATVLLEGSNDAGASWVRLATLGELSGALEGVPGSGVYREAAVDATAPAVRTVRLVVKGPSELLPLYGLAELSLFE